MTARHAARGGSATGSGARAPERVNKEDGGGSAYAFLGAPPEPNRCADEEVARQIVMRRLGAIDYSAMTQSERGLSLFHLTRAASCAYDRGDCKATFDYIEVKAKLTSVGSGRDADVELRERVAAQFGERFDRCPLLTDSPRIRAAQIRGKLDHVIYGACQEDASRCVEFWSEHASSWVREAIKTAPKHAKRLLTRPVSTLYLRIEPRSCELGRELWGLRRVLSSKEEREPKSLGELEHLFEVESKNCTSTSTHPDYVAIVETERLGRIATARNEQACLTAWRAFEPEYKRLLGATNARQRRRLQLMAASMARCIRGADCQVVREIMRADHVRAQSTISYSRDWYMSSVKNDFKGTGCLEGLFEPN